MINPDWPLRPLGELFEIGAGKTMSAAARDGEIKTPFLRTSNVLWDEIDLTTVDRMAIRPEELASKLLEPGDLLVCEGGEIGRAAIWNGEMELMSFQNHLHRLRPKADDIEPRFYVYLLQSAFTQLRIFEGAANRTTIPNLSRNRLGSLTVPLPTIGEQRNIVRTLAGIREAIALHDQSTILAIDLKRAAMRALFTRGLKSEPQKETEIGLVPQSWELTTLGELCDQNGGCIQTGPFGSQLHSHEYQDNGIPVINPTNLVGNLIDHADVPRVNETTAARLDRYKVQPGDILFGRRGEIGRHGLVSRSEEGWLCGTGCFLVRAFHPDVDNAFLSYFCSTEGVVAWLVAHATGSIMPNLNNIILGRLPAAYPTIAEQRDIVAILDAIDRKIDLHRRKRAVLDQLFKSLLHKLMTGEIRVADLDLCALETRAYTESAA
jgi:type I restriction enzyme, S subunit